MSFKDLDFKKGLKNHCLKKMSSSSGNFKVFVHAPVDVATSHGDESVMLVLFNPGRELWYLNADAFQYSCSMCWPAVCGITDVPRWVDTIQPFDQRLSEYSESSLTARSGGDGKHTTKLIEFVFHVEKDKCNETNLKNVLNSVRTFVK